MVYLPVLVDAQYGGSLAYSILERRTGGFLSMITVMLGMGLVMAFVTLAVVGASPKPDTAAFWGFASLGLLAFLVLMAALVWLVFSQGRQR